ncbi:MAG: 2,3-bisphosphoglycerate-independent phosphoglycerate mutase, partial [Spirochaetota bacterium]|nr:2,3-bisphosphoglycerate-independent phosphoglycerate mutase [Spirochaetota bacterium]
SIERTMAEYLVASGVRQFSISETQKFGHITYFFNGNRTGKFSEELETYEEIKSDRVPFEERPWMKAAEIADRVIEVIESGEYELIKLNFPNGDMVGHTGIYEAVLCAMEALDLSLDRIKKAVEKAGGVMIVSADHGNSDDMFERDKKTGEVKIKANGQPQAKTSHSLNPVPCIIFDPEYDEEYAKELRGGLGISSLAATTIELLGYEPPEDYDPSVFQWKK